MSYLRHFMQAASHRFTMWFGVSFGHHFPMHFICGFPRSGTTWFSEMLADYLNLPRPRHYILPIGFASVIHTHAEPTSRLNDCFYVIRDGRDALVSFYFAITRKLNNGEFVLVRRYRRLFGEKFDPKDIDRNLPLFLEDIFEHPHSTNSHWGEHVAGWLNKAESANGEIVIVYYEELLESAVSALTQVIRQKYGDVDTELVASVVERNAFQQQKQRPSGQQRTFLRKGQAGDWRNHFTPTCAEIFDHYAGDALIQAGYEVNHDWVKQPLIPNEGG